MTIKERIERAELIRGGDQEILEETRYIIREIIDVITELEERIKALEEDINPPKEITDDRIWEMFERAKKGLQ